jgi:pantothenate kinase
VGIAGAPGAGKSTVGAAVVDMLGPGAALLPMDGFHLSQARLTELHRRDRMGAPDTFDVSGFVALLRRVSRATGTVVAPGFDREVEEPTPGTVVIGANVRTVVVEGNYLLLDTGGWERVAPLLKLAFFVEAERDTRLARLVERHIAFGKDASAARAWANGPDEANARIILPTAARADHIIRL